MTETPGLRAKKEFTQPADDPWIEVLCFSKIARKITPYAFQTSNIHHLEKLSEDSSAIVLKCGTVIGLNIPYRTLFEKISSRLSPLDLKEHHGFVLPEAGEKMPDGTVYAGQSPDTSAPMFITCGVPKKSFNAAVSELPNLCSHGYNDWKLPTIEELRVIFENKEKGALREIFNSTGWYWSSSAQPNTDQIWNKSFSSGKEETDDKTRQMTYVPIRKILYSNLVKSPSL